MALFAIPNPKKSIQVNFSLEKVKLSVKNISVLNNKYKFTNSNEIFNQYTYEAMEFLSLGVYIDINLNSVTEDKTEIVVEVRRKLGSFDQSHEVTKANEHLVKIFDCIANLTAKSEEEIEALKANNIAGKSSNVNRNVPKSATKKSYNSLEKQLWYQKTWLVVILCIVFFPVGLYALWKNTKIKKGWKIFFTIIIAIIVLSNLGDDKSASKSSSGIGNESDLDSKSSESKPISVGDVLKTEYFEIIVNKVDFEKRVNTRNEYSDLKPEEGVTYLIINATFKNIDNESRMLDDGSVWINYNGKDYEFDKSEVVMAEGWGLLLDQINPLTSKTTNLVYKIPAEIKGNAYWQPGRANDDERIFLGTL